MVIPSGAMYPSRLSPMLTNTLLKILLSRQRSSRKRLFGKVIVLHGTFFNQFCISRRKKRGAPIATKARLDCVHIAPHRSKDEITIIIIGGTCADKAEKAWFVADNLNGRCREFFRQSAFTVWPRTGLE